MYMKQIIRFFKRENRLILGRWSHIKESDTFKRVDLANNDHCGSCHFMDIKKEESQESNSVVLTQKKQ